MKGRRSLGVGLLVIAAASVSCAEESSKAPVIVEAGKRTPVETTLPARKNADKDAILLELHNVVLPDRVTGLRVYVAPAEGTGAARTPVYVTSVARGHVSAANEPQSFSVDITRALERAAPDVKGGKVELQLEPIVPSTGPAAEPVRVEAVSLRVEPM